MATVKIDAFGGIIPRQHPTMLPDGVAVTAHNCRLKSGKLVPLHEPSEVDSYLHTVYMENGLGKIADANSLHCWKHTILDGTVRTDFLAFPGDVYFSRGNIANDSYDRVFVTGETGVTYTDSFGQSVENSPAAYLFDRSSNTILRHTLLKEAMETPRCDIDYDPDEGNLLDVYFFLSWVDRYGYESPASNPSLNKNRRPRVSPPDPVSDIGETTIDEDTWGDAPLKVNLGKPVFFEPVAVPQDAVAVRVYRTNSGSDATGCLQFVREFAQSELPSLMVRFSILITENDAAETMPMIEAPQSDLTDMTFVPGNFYAGRSPSHPHTVFFSDIDNPTHWALAYQYDVKDNLVRLAVTSNTVFALTDGYPYVFSGTAPESMTCTSLAGPAACVSAKGVCVYKNAVFFVSNYGLYTIYNDADAGTVCQCLTDQYFTKEQWQAFNPSSAILGQFDNALHLFFRKTDGTYVSVIYDLGEKACAITTHDEAASCLCTDDRTDEMYFVRVMEEA